MKTYGSRFVMPIAIAMVSIFGFFGVMHAQSSVPPVPQDVAAAATMYKVPTEVLFPVYDAAGASVVAWKIDGNAVTAVFGNGMCVDYITSKTSVQGSGSTQKSAIEDWTRLQATGVVTFSGPAATVYHGICGNITELTATVKVETLNVRRGPSTSTAILARAHLGQSVIVQAKSADGKWLFVIVSPEFGGWMFREYLDVIGDVNTLPVAEVLAPVRSKG